MSDELRAAAKRVLRDRKNPPMPHDDYERDTRLLADAWLFEHPSDDGELVTEEWLRSVELGFEKGVQFDCQTVAKVGSTMVGFHLDKFGVYVTFGDGYYVNGCYMGKTRRDVRLLCKALRIPMNEKASS